MGCCGGGHYRKPQEDGRDDQTQKDHEKSHSCGHSNMMLIWLLVIIGFLAYNVIR